MYRTQAEESTPQMNPSGTKFIIAGAGLVAVCAYLSYHTSSMESYASTSRGSVRAMPKLVVGNPARLMPTSPQGHLQAAPNGLQGQFIEAKAKAQEASSTLLTIAAPLLAAVSGLAYFLGRSRQPQLALAGAGTEGMVPTFFQMADGSAVATSGPSGGGSGGSPAPQQGGGMDLDQFTPSDLETMYVDALWAYYTEGKAILTDEQFAKLKMELNWQGSGFPTLHREEIEFVKAVLAYAKGEPILTDEEYDKLKERVEVNGKRRDVTAYLVMVKGKQLLSPGEFEQLRGQMKKAGVQAGQSSIAGTLSDTPNTLQYEVLEVLYMYSALGLVPSALCASSWGFLGFIMGGLSGLTTMATLGFPVIGASSFLLTRQIIRYLDLTGPRIVKGVCPVCESPIQASFFDCTPAQKVEKCSNCGTLSNLDSQKMLIRDAAGFTYVGDDADQKTTVDQYLSWASGVASGVLVGKSPVSQLGGRKAEADGEKPTTIPELLQKEISVGIFAWAVLLGYGLFGETFVSRARGKGIAIHSGAINDFCKRFNIPNGLRQKYIQTAKRNGHDLGFLVDGYGLIGDGLFGKQAMAWWKAQGF